MKGKLTLLIIVALLLFGGTALAKNDTRSIKTYKLKEQDFSKQDFSKQENKVKKMNESFWKNKLEQRIKQRQDKKTRGGDKRTQGQGDLEVLAGGGSVTKDGKVATQGIVIGNLSKTKMAENVRVRIIILDASGKEIATQEELLWRIPADRVAVVGSVIKLSGEKPSELRAEISPEKMTTQPKDAKFFNFEDAKFGEGGNGAEVTGGVHNPFDTNIDTLRIYAVFGTGDEKEPDIVAGAFADVKSVGAGKTEQFTVSTNLFGLNPTTAAVFANPIGQKPE